MMEPSARGRALRELEAGGRATWRTRVATVITVAVIACALSSAALGRLGPARVSAVGGEPGSPEDPLITRSYFERYTSLNVVNVPAGGRIACEAGAEIILRAGKATAIGSTLGGLSDVTAGKDVQTGQALTANHLLIVPRGDGRGLKAVTDCVVMVRGAYTAGQ